VRSHAGASDLTRLQCPHCNRRSSTQHELKEGTKVRCPACRNPFEYHLHSHVGNDKQGGDDTTPPERSSQRGMGGLFDFSQTELVEPVSELALRQAMAESQRGNARPRALGIMAIGCLVLLGMAILRYAPWTRPEPTSPSATRTSGRAPSPYVAPLTKREFGN
jgi:hypothetical protein